MTRIGMLPTPGLQRTQVAGLQLAASVFDCICILCHNISCTALKANLLPLLSLQVGCLFSFAQQARTSANAGDTKSS